MLRLKLAAIIGALVIGLMSAVPTFAGTSSVTDLRLAPGASICLTPQTAISYADVQGTANGGGVNVAVYNGAVNATNTVFLALNSNGAVGPGYLPASYGPFKVTPSTGGIANTTNPAGQTRFNNRMKLLHTLDDGLRQDSPNGNAVTDYDSFYDAAQGMMYNPVVNQAFGFTAAESQRYGNSGLGNAMLVAAQVLKANQGTRFVQITSNDGWDMHQNIYAANTLPAKAKILDDGLSTLIADLKSAGLLDSTLIVMAGEFGRTVGPITAQGGRDHWPQQFAFFAGGGVKGGKIIGRTDDRGADVVDFGWSEKRYVYAEDIEATIYSAVGIDWTTVRHDDPFGRGFEYVPKTGPFAFMPVHELWG